MRKNLMLFAAVMSLSNFAIANEKLLEAVSRNDVSEVKRIIKSDRTVKINFVDQNNNTSLLIASKEGFTEVANILIKARPNLEIKGNFEIAKSISALNIAVLNMHPDIASRLIDAGADVNSQDEKGGSPLDHASYRGYPDIVKKLLAKKAVVDIKDKYDSTPLATAANYGHIEIVKMLISAGADVNRQDDFPGTTALIYAVNGWVDSAELVNLLVKSGARVDTQDVFGETALMRAASKNKINSVKELLRLGASTKLTDDKGETAYTIALKNNFNEIAELIKSYNN